MPRGPGGTYQLPAGNPVVPGTIIESDWANPTMSDIGQELSDSLSRSGKGGMLSALRGLDGSAAVPTFSFTNEPATGRYRAGPGQVVESVDGVPVVRYLSTGLEQWDQTINGGLGGWIPLTPRDAAGTPFNPDPTDLTSTNVQAAIEEVNAKTGGTNSADNTTYDDTNVYFPAGNVQQAIDRLGNDLAGLANDILDNTDAILILDGELQLLTNRVTLNETNIGNNTTNIALLDTRIDNHDIDINNLQQTQSSILLEQTQQNSDIQGNTDYIDAVYAITQGQVGDIDNLQAQINAINLEQTQQNSDIAFNLNYIDNVYTITQNNAGLINDNANDISQNTADISDLDGRLDGYDNAFTPGGVLQVIYGGTGVQQKTGTDKVVLSSNPAISGGSVSSAYLSGCAASTPPSVAAGTEVPTAAWVRAFLNDNDYRPRQSGSNANGMWLWFEETDGILIQFGQRNNTGIQNVTLPVAYNNGVPLAWIQQIIGGYTAPWGTCPVVTSSLASYIQVATDHHFWWLTIGLYV